MPAGVRNGVPWNGTQVAAIAAVAEFLVDELFDEIVDETTDSIIAVG